MKKCQNLLLSLILILNFFAIKGQNMQIAKDKVTFLIKKYNRHPQSSKIQEFSKDIEAILDTVFDKYYELKMGKVYSTYYNVSGSPFLFENKSNGELDYNGNHYRSINMFYNIYQDELVCLLEHKNRSFSIILNSTLIDSFSIEKRKFLNYTKVNNGLNGIYEQIYHNNGIELIAKWRKSIYRGGENKNVFTGAERRLFLLKNDKIYKLKKKKDLLVPFHLPKFPKRNGRKIKIPKLSDASNDNLIEIIEYFQQIDSN